MRAIVKLSLIVAVAYMLQWSGHAAVRNAAEINFQWQVMSAQLRGVPADSPYLLNLAEPLLGFKCWHPAEQYFNPAERLEDEEWAANVTAKIIP